MVRIIILLALVLSQMICGCPDRMLPDGAPYIVRAFEYSFHHASWLHLAINGIALWGVYSPKRKGIVLQLLMSYLIAVVVYPVSFRPCLGFSNILYATLGMRTPELNSPWWRTPSVIVFLAVTVVMVFLPQFSGMTHLLSFLLGMICATICRVYRKNVKDAGRFVR